MFRDCQSFELYLTAVDRAIAPERLRFLAFHCDEAIRSRVAENPRLPLECLLRLAFDEAPEVRIALTENPATPWAILEVIADDPHPDVRYAMAENANIPLFILESLAQDEHPYIADRAARTIERLNVEWEPMLRCA